MSAHGFCYDDLFTVPYKENGRGALGMDCYGLCIELCRRAGKRLADVARGEALNVRKIPQEKARAGAIVQIGSADTLHIGYVLDRTRFIHMTDGGARVSALIQLRDPTFFEVTE